LFPAKPDPSRRFTVGLIHQALMREALESLEDKGYDFVIFDGESGKRQMADIAIKLADVILIFFRLTHQHIEGSLETAKLWLSKLDSSQQFYLVPTIVPLVGEQDGVYLNDAPGLDHLRVSTTKVPNWYGLNEFANNNKGDETDPGPGYFWASDPRMCIHESLALKGGERIVVYNPHYAIEQASRDYYNIARELCRLHPN